MDSSRVRKIFKHKSYTKVNIPNLLLRSFTLICTYVDSNMSFTFIQKRYSIRLTFSMTTPFFVFTNKIQFYSKEPPIHRYIYLYLRQMRMFQKSMSFCLRMFCLIVVVSQMCFHVVTSAVFVVTKLALNV